MASDDGDDALWVQARANAAEILRLRERQHDIADKLQGLVLEHGMTKLQLQTLQTELLDRQRTFRWIVGVAIAVGPTVAVIVADLLH